MWVIYEYDEKYITNLFNATNQIKIKKIRIELDDYCSNEEIKVYCTKIEDKITQKLIHSDVSCFT